VGLESVNVPMVLGRVRDEPSDMVAAGGSCVVVVPHARAADVLRIAEEIEAKEDLLLRDLRAAADLAVAHRRHGYDTLQSEGASRLSTGPEQERATTPRLAHPLSRGGAPRPQHGLWRGRSPVRGAAAKTAAAGSHFRPTTTKSGPARAPPAFRGSPFPASTPCGPRRCSRSRRGAHQHVQAHQEPEGVLPARVLD
jgi:hypothetical protein